MTPEERPTCGWALWDGVTDEQLERGDIPLCGEPAMVKVIVSPVNWAAASENRRDRRRLIEAYTHLCFQHRGQIVGREELLDVPCFGRPHLMRFLMPREWAWPNGYTWRVFRRWRSCLGFDPSVTGDYMRRTYGWWPAEQ